MNPAIRASHLAALTAFVVASARAAQTPFLVDFLLTLDRIAETNKPRRQSGTSTNAICRREAKKRREKSRSRQKKRS